MQQLLPVLCKDHGLTRTQVVAIASKEGSKQALESVQRLLPVLCKKHGLTPEQVVTIASNDGGRQALEAVQRLLPVLCNDHGLTRNQVVSIASNHGGKQALETVQRLLPLLCKDHGLTPAQVVAIASNHGGRQALDSLFAQLSCPDPALAALSKERLVALACLGGRPALEAVIKGLPHAATLIRKANQRVPDRTSHRVADAVQVLQVLNFFQCHSDPMHAFDDAMTQFEISKSELLHLFRRVGVTEFEARSGTLPPASKRWQRILQALGDPSPSASSPTPTSTPPQESWHAFADCLERELDAPSPMHEDTHAPTSSLRKRPRSDDSVNHSPQQPAEVRACEQPDLPDVHLPSGWDVKRPRTKISGGLPDPGTPTDADLAASSTVFVGQDAASSSGTEEDFPVFDDEQMEWLMQLFP